MKYTNECSFSEFWNSINEGIVVAVILSAIILIAGALVCMCIDVNNRQEQNLYLAIKGENVSSQEAIQIAGFVKAVYQGQPQNASVLNRMVYGNDTHDLTVFAFNHWGEVTEYIENPDKEVFKENVWLGFGQIFFVAAFIIFAIGAAVDYVDDGNRDWWKYPWKRWWAYPFIPLMLIIILIQPFVLLYYVKRQIDGSDKREEERKHEETNRRAEYNKEFLEDQINAANRLQRIEQSRESWAKIFTETLKGQKQALKSEIETMRSSLTNLGSQIEVKQRDLANAAQDLKEIDMAIKSKSSRAAEEYKQEFDRILGLRNVKAVEVGENRVSVYTGPVILRGETGRKHLIGYGFEIRLNTGRNPSIKARNLANTCVNKYHHPFSVDDTDDFCFGHMNGIVRDLLKKRDYLTLIIVALEAINSAEGSGRRSLTYWKEIKDPADAEALAGKEEAIGNG